MDIQQMQSLLQAKGIRIANDDPIFTLLALNEIALDDLTKRHHQELNTDSSQLPQLRAEVRLMADALVNLAELTTLVRQVLSGENEKISDDVNAVKGSVEKIAQQIADGATTDDHDLHGKIEIMTAAVAAAADSVKGTRAILHRHNEALLMDRIQEITNAVQQIKDIEELLRSTASKQIDSLAAPVVLQMSEQVKRLAEKDTYAMKFMQKTNSTQEKMAANMEYSYFVSGLLVVFALAVGCSVGYFLK